MFDTNIFLHVYLKMLTCTIGGIFILYILMCFNYEDDIKVYTCMCICMFIYVHFIQSICIYIHIYIHIYVYIYSYIYTHIYHLDLH